MAPQLVEKEVYVNMKALEEEAVVRLWEPVGARTDRKLGLITNRAWNVPEGGASHRTSSSNTAD